MRIKNPCVQKLFCWWMMAIFFFAITPHQFIHDEIERHKDTVDVIHKYTSVSSHHIHCEFLRVVHLPFTDVNTPLVKQVPLLHLISFRQVIPFKPSKTLFHFRLRGPPLQAVII